MYIISIGYPEFCWSFKYIYIFLFLIIKILKSKQKSILYTQKTIIVFRYLPINSLLINSLFLGIYL